MTNEICLPEIKTYDSANTGNNASDQAPSPILQKGLGMRHINHSCFQPTSQLPTPEQIVCPS